MRALRARLLAFGMEHRAWHEACVADVLPMEDVEDLVGETADAERYGIAWGDDPLDKVDIGVPSTLSAATSISFCHHHRQAHCLAFS
ncbi:hypothetical protein Droror1_Dr00016260, partial [Drosera rotundifolia]